MAPILRQKKPLMNVIANLYMVAFLLLMKRRLC